jgi:hypothetical protein
VEHVVYFDRRRQLESIGHVSNLLCDREGSVPLQE